MHPLLFQGIRIRRIKLKLSKGPTWCVCDFQWIDNYCNTSQLPQRWRIRVGIEPFTYRLRYRPDVFAL